MLTSAKDAQQLRDRVVQLVDDAFLERNEGVVGNRDPFRADLRAALGDVAVPDSVSLLEISRPMFRVDRVHLQRRGVEQVTRTDELVEERMIAQHVADVLAEETLDAL